MNGYKQNSFDVPEGCYRMKVVSGNLGMDRGGSERLRIVGDLVSLPSRIYNFQAGINYREGSLELLPDLHEILGAHVVELVGENGEVLPEGLPILEGKECDVQIVHVHSPKHGKPFCNVVRVTKPGVLAKYPDKKAA